MRALVLPESDLSEEKLFVIQLLQSQAEIAPETVPNLAIFNEFRLYCAVVLQDDRLMHVLRLGFFTDEASAAAVAGYLGGFFETAAVTRVSHAERERFAGQRVTASKDSGDSGSHAAIELSSPPAAPPISLSDLAASVRSAAASATPPLRSRSPTRS